MKQFETKEMLDAWIEEKFYRKNTENVWDLTLTDATDEEIVKALAGEGYDLDNLVADGHAYEIGGHTNNGWLYEDEADKFYIESNGLSVELRKRGE